MEPDALRAIVADHRTAGLDEADVAIMDLAEKVADEPDLRAALVVGRPISG